MIRGLYSSASNLTVQLARQEIISSNIANVNTVGYKGDMLPIRRSASVGIPGDFRSILNTVVSRGTLVGEIGQVGSGVITDPVVTYFDQGNLQVTGRSLDIALVGDGFFSLMTAEGDISYSRAGDFARSSDGFLVNAEGMKVLGYDGPISIGQGQFDVEPNGEMYQDGQLRGRLLIVDFDNKSDIRKIGGSIFSTEDEAALPNPVNEHVVQQGSLEFSNVSPAQATIEMIAARRSFESSHRMIQLQDQMLGLAVTEIAKI